jgi:hypothetical protein
MKPLDLTLKRFGALTVIERVGADPGGNSIWRCLCDCGKFTLVLGNNLQRGRTRSCSCKQGGKPIIHGHARRGKTSKEFIIWSGMRRRCNDPNQARFVDYGGRGIKICERWQKFENFLADMSPHPGKGFSLDRIDNDGNYEPGNCRWATRSEQMRNRRSFRIGQPKL